MFSTCVFYYFLKVTYSKYFCSPDSIFFALMGYELNYLLQMRTWKEDQSQELAACKQTNKICQPVLQSAFSEKQSNKRVITKVLAIVKTVKTHYGVWVRIERGRRQAAFLDFCLGGCVCGCCVILWEKPLLMEAALTEASESSLDA